MPAIKLSAASISWQPIMIAWIYCVLDLGQFFGLMREKKKSYQLSIITDIKFVYFRH